MLWTIDQFKICSFSNLKEVTSFNDAFWYPDNRKLKIFGLCAKLIHRQGPKVYVLAIVHRNRDIRILMIFWPGFLYHEVKIQFYYLKWTFWTLLHCRKKLIHVVEFHEISSSNARPVMLGPPMEVKRIKTDVSSF